MRRPGHRRPARAEAEAVITIDLLADWRPYADPLPPPATVHTWRYHGTITRDGITGALAWRSGGYGIGHGPTVKECGLWDRIKITRILSFDAPPGLEGIPQFPSARDSWPLNS